MMSYHGLTCILCAHRRCWEERTISYDDCKQIKIETNIKVTEKSHGIIKYVSYMVPEVSNRLVS